MAEEKTKLVEIHWEETASRPPWAGDVPVELAKEITDTVCDVITWRPPSTPIVRVCMSHFLHGFSSGIAVSFPDPKHAS